MEQEDPQPSGRAWTVSLAVPGSIIDNTQNMEFAMFVAGQVRRGGQAALIPQLKYLHQPGGPTGLERGLASSLAWASMHNPSSRFDAAGHADCADSRHLLRGRSHHHR